MTHGDLEEFLLSLGLQVAQARDASGTVFTVIQGLQIERGKLKGQDCDVAIQHMPGDAFVMPAAVHTRPALLPMQGGEPYGTQASSLGPEWQYWSRRMDRSVTPRSVLAHILAVLESAP